MLKTSASLFKLQICLLENGKGLGGTTGKNGMIYLRGSPYDFDAWAKVSNDSVWSYKSVLKAFKKSEDYHGFFYPSGLIFT